MKSARFTAVIAAFGFAIAAMIAPAPAAQAETLAFAVDTAHSSVGFKVRHLVAKTTGIFNEFEGTVWVDPDNIAETLRVEGEVKTASVNTHNEDRDNHLRSPDFFKVEEHPTMTFVSKSVRADDDMYLVTGDLTLLGITKEVTFEAEVNGFATNPFSKTPTTGVDLEGDIRRKDFGMVWNKALDAGGVVLGEKVQIELHLEATVPPSAG